VTGTPLVGRLPNSGAGFVWDAFEESILLRPETETVRAAFTTRVGGDSVGPYASFNVSFAVGDDRDSVLANRERANRAIGRTDVASWGRIKQVHSDRVVRAAADGELREADGVWTDDPGDVVAVNGGDCLPLLLIGERRIAAAHAGWRGLVAGIVEAAATAVEATHAWIGPGIGPCCYEVGESVAGSITDRFGAEAMSGRFADLWLAAESAAGGTSEGIGCSVEGITSRGGMSQGKSIFTDFPEQIKEG